MKRNWPFIIITGFGIIATLIFLYIFVYGLAVNTVKSAALLEKAYPHIKPQEYMNIFKRQAAANGLKIIKITQENSLFLIFEAPQKAGELRRRSKKLALNQRKKGSLAKNRATQWI